MRMGEHEDVDGIGETDVNKLLDQAKSLDITKITEMLKQGAAAYAGRERKSKPLPMPAPAPAPSYQAPQMTEGIGIWPIVAVLGGVGILAFALLSKKGGPLAGLADALELPTGR